MNRISVTGIGLLLSFTACSSNEPATGGTGGQSNVGTGGSATGAGKGGTGTGGSAGTATTGGSAGTTAPATGGSGGSGVTAGTGAGTVAVLQGIRSAAPRAPRVEAWAARCHPRVVLPGLGVAGTGPAGGSAGQGGDAGASSTGVTVQLTQTHQKIQGFGINDNWASAAFSSSVADSLFTTTGTGIGLTILRTGMSDAGAFYNSYESTNISAVKSRAGTDAKIIGSVWSPPANCKSNTNVNDGGHLNTGTCYDTWSTTIANFAGTNGFYAMSVGNEPEFASCGTADPCNGNYPTTLFTATEMVNFVKIAGPKIQAKGVKVIAPEVSEWTHMWSNVSAGPDVGGKNSSDPLKCGFPPSNTVCDSGGGYDYGHYLAKDADAWKAFDIIGVHEYDSQHAEPWPTDVTAARKEVWQTEMSGVKWWPEQGPSSDIANGVAVAGWIHDALVTGDASAWLWWWYQAANTDDNEGLLLKSGTDTRRHYTLATTASSYDRGTRGWT